jgi:hypothetical protein
MWREPLTGNTGENSESLRAFLGASTVLFLTLFLMWKEAKTGENASLTWTAFDCLCPMPFPKDRDKVAEAVKKLV